MPRLFFALWPDPAVRDELYRVAQAMQRDCGGRVMWRDNLHQTLVFVGNVAAEKIAALEAAAGRIAAGSFQLEFGTIGYWRHNRIVWAAPVTTPASLLNLVAALEQELAQSSFVFDQRQYVAHITLVRDAHAPAALPSLRLAWQARDFALVESCRGSRGVEYGVIARWPLRG
jgi:2'-5' RNA ligase